MILILNHLKEIETDRVDRERKHSKNQQIAKSIDMCDCSSPSLMKKWLSDIDITQLHTGSGFLEFLKLSNVHCERKNVFIIV